MCAPEDDLLARALMGEPVTGRPSGVTRRTFLGAVGAGVGAALLPAGAASAAGGSTSALSGRDPLLAAMHVHASWSEQGASWEQQFARAAAQGVDVVYMTDHDWRALAVQYLRSFDGVQLDPTTTGVLRRAVTDQAGPAVHLVAEAGGAAPAAVTVSVHPLAAKNRLRTGIGGTTLTPVFGAGRLTRGATYELVVTLSDHPAHGTRPAGSFSLRYRWGTSRSGRAVEGGGRTGVVHAPLPPAGTAVRLDLAADVAQFWPDMLAADNGLQMLALVATSPRAGAVADVRLRTLQVDRSEATEQAVIARQREIVEACADRHPGLVVHPSVELSKNNDLFPHWCVYGAPQRFPEDKAAVTVDGIPAYYSAFADTVHAQGGLVSWNHPFGPAAGPLLSQAEQDRTRRLTFQQLYDSRLYGADVLEVAYVVRQGHGIASHLALWDTFSRHARFLTGNGANDDHVGGDWDRLGNGFATGIWGASTSQQDLADALAAGRAYSVHPGHWPGGQLDLLVDDRVPMGAVDVAAQVDRTLAVQAQALPADSTVELVRGEVDLQGVDPLTSTTDRLAAADFSGSGAVTRPVDTTTSCFVRAQVRGAQGQLIGVSNPVWLLREEPPDGVPDRRRVA